VDVRFLALSPLDAAVDLLVVGVDASLDALNPLDTALGGKLRPWLVAHKFEAGAGEAEVVPGFGGIKAAGVAILGLGDRSRSALAKAAGKIGLLARDHRAQRVAIHLGGLDPATAGLIIEFVAVGNYLCDSYIPEDKRRPALTELAVLGQASSPALEEAARVALVRAANQAFTRDLVNMPAADLYPMELARRAQTLAAIPGVEVEVWDIDRCKAEGLVGIVAVGQGSSQPGCLVQLRYRPANPKDHIALVGKGVTFDSGGLSLKPSNFMQTMRCDMGGAATTLGAFGAIASLGLPIAIDAFLPCVENMCAANSYKLGDILRYRNGVTVEIHNTDAEGRLILADALILACEVPGVSRIVDLATLTGAVIIALGPEYTGLFTSDDALAAELQTAATDASELMWRLPLYAPYKRGLKGTWSQLKNVGGRDGGSITAALFLQHFVKEGTRWAHLDIAGTAFADTATDPYVAGGTGQVVRTLVNWAATLAK
jgi:leucyl aminopeptidase